MSDLAAMLYVVLEDEVAAFWCFVHWMQKLASNFDDTQSGIIVQLAHLSRLIRYLDPGQCKSMARILKRVGVGVGMGVGMGVGVRLHFALTSPSTSTATTTNNNNTAMPHESRIELSRSWLCFAALSFVLTLVVYGAELMAHLEEQHSDHFFFCFRWLIVLFKREFEYTDTMTLWEVRMCFAWADHALFIIAAVEGKREVKVERVCLCISAMSTSHISKHNFQRCSPLLSDTSNGPGRRGKSHCWSSVLMISVSTFDVCVCVCVLMDETNNRPRGASTCLQGSRSSFVSRSSCPSEKAFSLRK